MVVDLREGADRRTGIAQRDTLVDRDDREQAAYFARFGLARLFPGVPASGKEVLQEQPLPLPADNVVHQAGFPAAGHAGHRDEPVMRYLHGDPLEVVLGGAGDDYLGSHFNFTWKSSNAASVRSGLIMILSKTARGPDGVGKYLYNAKLFKTTLRPTNPEI